MNNEKMRKEFEAWYWINYQVKHSMSINEVFSMDSFDEYRLTIVSVAYDSWKASRAALCVKLPLAFSDERATTCLTSVTNALDAYGVRYK